MQKSNDSTRLPPCTWLHGWRFQATVFQGHNQGGCDLLPFQLGMHLGQAGESGWNLHRLFFFFTYSRRLLFSRQPLVFRARELAVVYQRLATFLGALRVIELVEDEPKIIERLGAFRLVLVVDDIDPK